MPESTTAPAALPASVTPAGTGRRPVHPVAYLLMILPFGTSSGYVSVTLGYQLSRAGVDPAAIGAMIALTFVPQSWKFLWAPVTDSTFTRKTWFLIGALATCGTYAASATLTIDAAAVPILQVLMLVQSFAITFMAMAVEALLVHNTPPEQRGRASGWFQAGNMGGGGFGGGAALWITQHSTAQWAAPASLGLVALVCALPLLWFNEPTRQLAADGSSGRAGLLAQKWSELVLVLKDVWTLGTSRRGLLAGLALFLPLGTGAASALWSPAADFWHASADTVALVNGTLGGVVSMAGCFVAGPLLDRMDRKAAYLLFGAMQAGVAIAMAVTARTETTFIVYSLAYSLTQGLTFTAYAAVVLEIAGLRSAATQWNVYASLSNMPIGFMVYLNGLVFAKYGPSSMLWFEALAAFAAIAVFAAAARLSQRAGAKR